MRRHLLSVLHVIPNLKLSMTLSIIGYPLLSISSIQSVDRTLFVSVLLNAKVRANVYATTFVRTLYVIMSKGIIDYFFNLP